MKISRKTVLLLLLLLMMMMIIIAIIITNTIKQVKVTTTNVKLFLKQKSNCLAGDI